MLLLVVLRVRVRPVLVVPVVQDVRALLGQVPAPLPAVGVAARAAGLAALPDQLRRDVVRVPVGRRGRGAVPAGSGVVALGRWGGWGRVVGDVEGGACGGSFGLGVS